MKDDEGVFKRIKIALNAKNDTEVAEALGIRQPSVASARKQGKIPPAWIQKIAEEHSISADWLFFGIGTKELNIQAKSSGASGKLISLLREIIIKFENDIAAHNLSLDPDVKSTIICSALDQSIINNFEFNSYVYDQMIFLAKRIDKLSKIESKGKSNGKLS